jgi:LysR family glycine cleavage system transcriptional activator
MVEENKYMTYRLPSLNTLRAFEASARHLSFKIAASELGVTAGAVSQQVKKLEASLGIKLFRRLPHGILLTPQGELYFPKISKVFEDLTEATELIAPKINSKKVKVGVCSKAMGILPKNWPNHDNSLKAHVQDAIETSDIQLIWNNEVDCLIRLGGGPYGDLSLVKVHCSTSSEEIHFVCKAGFVDCRQSRAILENLNFHMA